MFWLDARKNLLTKWMKKKSIMGHYAVGGGPGRSQPPGLRWWWDSMINGSNSSHKKWAPHSSSRQSPWLLLDLDDRGRKEIWKTQEFLLFMVTGHIPRLKCEEALPTRSPQLGPSRDSIESPAISRQSPAISIIHFSIKFFWSRTNPRTLGSRAQSWTSVKIGRMRIIAYEAPWRAEPNPRVKIKWAIKNRVRGA